MIFVEALFLRGRGRRGRRTRARRVGRSRGRLTRRCLRSAEDRPGGMALAAGKHGKRNRSQHEDDGGPGGGLAQNRGRAARTEGGLAAPPPNAAAISALWPLCSSTTMMIKRQTTMCRIVMRTVIMFSQSGARERQVRILTKFRGYDMVRKGGLEPPCLAAPPPQDGVSANFTTSAQLLGEVVPTTRISVRGHYSSSVPMARPQLPWQCGVDEAHDVAFHLLQFGLFHVHHVPGLVGRVGDVFRY